MIILDNYLWEKLQAHAPHKGAMDLMRPWTVSRNMGLAVPVLSTINAWLADGISQPQQ